MPIQRGLGSDSEGKSMRFWQYLFVESSYSRRRGKPMYSEQEICFHASVSRTRTNGDRTL